ncbi:thiol reductant ABC exporter subunit CydD [Pseudothioclava arenosa]|uniref:Thiol reductant ABC exporter subunit CydD n=1 Tax=Pseudothioclava arenosa TaxID=1795308 RepID=A0A2A4CNS7_9RHOB|nr:thiol reductant ABC exporter subunit CydD [Pseudothioclava arenosa]PCD76255.1 thiol reductant ABC exporter subunit CydD [Pseudothioclava arenosa]
MARASTPQGHLTAPSRTGALLSLTAALVWPAQAALIAAVFAGLLSGAPTISPLIAAAGFFTLAALRAGLEAAAQRKLARAAEAVIATARHQIVQTESHAASSSSLGNAGALAALATDKLEALRPYLLRYRPARLRSMVMPLVILAIALWYGWAVAVVLLLAGPLIPLFMALVGWAAKEASARQMVEIGQLSDLLIDRLAALSDLRLIGAGPAAIEGFHAASESLRHRTMAVLRIAFLSSTVLELFSALGVAMVAVWVGFALLGEVGWGTWGTPLSPFGGMFLLLLAPEFFQPLRDLAAAWHDKAGAEAVLAELADYEAEDRPGLPGHDLPATGQPPAGPIAWRGLVARRGGVLIRYPDAVIAPGARIAITGPSGAGKTTLLRLLAGLDLPAEGTLHVGATALSEAHLPDWRAGLGWMPQAPHFLDRSLRQNIGFGRPLPETVLDQAQLGPVIAALPKGLNTVLGERGAGLSGGEARRVTLARALAAGQRVLLADEPTADLDPDTAAAVTAGLLDFAAAGGTLILATHDPALIARVDQVIALGPEEATP